MKPLNYISEDDKPKTETVPKTVKKSLIHWIVPAICTALALAFFTLVQSWGDDRYTRRSDFDKQQILLGQRIQNEVQKREALENQMQDMNRKLDLIVYILQTDPKSNGERIPPSLSNRP